MKTLLKRATLGLLAVSACAFAAPALAAVDCTTATTPNTLGTTANAQFELLQKLCAAQTSGGLAASGAVPVTASLTAPGNTAAFTAVAGRLINANVTGTGVGVQSRLVRSFDNGVTWLGITVSGQPYGVWSGNVSEQAWVESQVDVLFRIEVTAITSGTVNLSLSQ
jgi:hypothetical protein